MQIPYSIIQPFEPVGFPISQRDFALERKIAKIEEALVSAFKEMLWVFECLSNKTSAERELVRKARENIKIHLRSAAHYAGAGIVEVSAIGDGTMIPIEYTVIFDGHIRKLLQHID